jgi:hypothetical protein
MFLVMFLVLLDAFLYFFLLHLHFTAGGGSGGLGLGIRLRSLGGENHAGERYRNNSG